MSITQFTAGTSSGSKFSVEILSTIGTLLRHKFMHLSILEFDVSEYNSSVIDLHLY